MQGGAGEPREPREPPEAQCQEEGSDRDRLLPEHVGWLRANVSAALASVPSCLSKTHIIVKFV